MMARTTTASENDIKKMGLTLEMDLLTGAGCGAERNG